MAIFDFLTRLGLNGVFTQSQCEDHFDAFKNT